MKVVLLRTTDAPDGVFGVLDLYDGAGAHAARYYTAEEEWLDNAPNVSCIPAGTYLCRRTLFHKHGYETFEVTNVPGRSHILIHPGNTEEHTEGCILLGRRFGTATVIDEDNRPHMRDKWAVQESKKAFDDFMERLSAANTFELEVRWQMTPGEWRRAA